LKHITKRTCFVFVILSLFVILSGCGNNGGGGGEDPHARVSWNFLVYMDGDNNLEYAAIDDFNEMEEIGSTGNVNILVLFDRKPGDDDSNGNWTDTRLFRVTKDSNTSLISSAVIEAPGLTGELNMGDPQTLSTFINYCQTIYPADRTVLTLWNHGGGVYPKAATKPPSKAICVDDTSSGDELTLAEAASALSQANPKIDIVNMDACLMQMIEVAYEWKDDADYLVGSEANVPGDGNNYYSVIDTLTLTPNITARDLALAIVDTYCQKYNGSDTTYSALSLGAEFPGEQTHMQTLIDCLKTFATALLNTPEANLASIQTARSDTYYFGLFNREFGDLYSFAAETINHVSDTTVTTAAENLQTALANAVIHHHETGSYVGAAYGLSILLPSYSEWSFYDGSNQYMTLTFCNAANGIDWYNFILRYTAYDAL